MLRVVIDSLAGYLHLCVAPYVVACIGVRQEEGEIAAGNLQSDPMSLFEKIARSP